MYDFFAMFYSIKSYISCIIPSSEIAMYDFFAQFCSIKSYSPYTFYKVRGAVRFR